MTPKKIVAMAREAGLHKMIQVKHVVEKVYEIPSEKLTHFAQLVAEHEREECAKLIESGKFGIGNMMSMHDDESVAAAIRQRGMK